MREIKFSDALIGDIVWSQANGEGIIQEIIEGHIYPLRVIWSKQEKGSHARYSCFALDGKFDIHDSFPTLFHNRKDFEDCLAEGRR